MSDVRLQEGLKACINCGPVPAVCPAAEFYRYNPKNIVNIVQTQDDEEIIKLAQERHDMVLRRVHVLRDTLSAGPMLRGR